MILLIDGKPAAIKEGTSIEYTSDNRLFHDREDYTMSIELPLHCRENASIFGHISRKDAEVGKIYFDAEIIDRKWRKSGAVVITNITDTMAKVQFVGGRSYQNFYPAFDETYIDELELGAIPVWTPDNIGDLEMVAGNDMDNNRNGRASTRGGGAQTRGDNTTVESEGLSPAQAWGTGDIIALPWVNGSSGNIQNRADYVYRGGVYKWEWHVRQDDADDTELVRGLSCQARLYFLAEKICSALGYTLEAQGWVESDYYNLYSFNSLPFAWGTCRWQDTLPHWSVNEFFEHLERLMLCEFSIDHKNKSIAFSWSNENAANAGTVHLEQIVDEYTATISKDDDSQYTAMRNVGYADGGHNMSSIYDCEWYFRKSKVWVQEYDTLREILDFLNDKPASWFYGEAKEMIFHANDVDGYFIMYVDGRYLYDRNQVNDINKYINTYKLLPLNAYGARIFDEEKWEEREEIGIVPVWIDETDKGWLPFFEAGELDNSSMSGMQYKKSFNGWSPVNDEGDVEPDQILQSYKFRRIKEGDKDGKTNYSSLQVGFWYGMDLYDGRAFMPHPFLDEYEIITESVISPAWYQQIFSVLETRRNGSLRLNSDKYGQGKELNKTISIESHQKYEFSFLMDGMPDVMATYIIRGKKYLCASIKAEITADGMSEMKKGVFYRILE